MTKNKRIRSPWQYILNRRVQDYADSTVLGLTGVKRSLKSLLLCKLLFRDLCLGRKVWSNMPVHTPDFFIKQGYPYLETMAIDPNALYSLSEEYIDGTVGIDEAKYINSNRRSLTTRNNVVDAFLNEVGHRSIDVIWTAKSLGWLDRQGLGFETDIEVICHDLAKTRWGRINKYPKGRTAILRAFDRSGAFTGTSNPPESKWSRPFVEWREVDLWHYWTGYDTRSRTSLEDIFGSVKMDMKQTIITNKKQLQDGFLEEVYEVAIQLRDNSESPRVDAAQLRAAIKYTVADVSDRVIGETLKSIGAVHKQKRGGNVYDLDNLFLPGY